MRRYCRNVDITDIGFIERCIYLWIEEKKSRRDVQHFLAGYTDLTYRQIRKMIRIGVTDWLPDCLTRAAEDVQRRLIEEKLDLPPIEFKDKYDDVCCKWRRIGIQKPIHQIFDYIAVEACKEMLWLRLARTKWHLFRGAARNAVQSKFRSGCSWIRNTAGTG